MRETSARIGTCADHTRLPPMAQAARQRIWTAGERRASASGTTQTTSVPPPGTALTRHDPP
jgi:hypothetical protein